MLQCQCVISKNTASTLETLESLWQYQRDVPSNPIADSESFKFKVTIKESTLAGGNTKDTKFD